MATAMPVQNADTPVRLVDLPRRLPRRPDGARVDFSTVWAWATTGPEADRLAMTIIDDVPHTTGAAVLEFLARRRSAEMRTRADGPPLNAANAH